MAVQNCNLFRPLLTGGRYVSGHIMKIYKIILHIFLLVFCLSYFGCSNSELEKTKSALKQAHENITLIQDELDYKSYILDNHIKEKKGLQKELSKLKEINQKYENLLISEPKLKSRLNQLISIRQTINEYNAEKNHFPKVILSKIDNRIVYIKVNDEELLTQRMGTYGASEYMKEVQNTITAVEGIDCVYFDIEEGDHAFPGKYCK